MPDEEAGVSRRSVFWACRPPENLSNRLLPSIFNGAGLSLHAGSCKAKVVRSTPGSADGSSWPRLRILILLLWRDSIACTALNFSTDIPLPHYEDNQLLFGGCECYHLGFGGLKERRRSLAFIPMLTVLVVLALRFGKDPPFAIWAQTLGFVAFNKVARRSTFFGSTSYSDSASVKDEISMAGRGPVRGVDCHPFALAVLGIQTRVSRGERLSPSLGRLRPIFHRQYCHYVGPFEGARLSASLYKWQAPRDRI